MSVDLRTRNDADIRDVDIGDFFGRQFPALLQRGSKYLQPWLANTTLVDCTFECADQCWHVSAAAGKVRADSGRAEQGLVVRLTGEDFSGLINDLYTPMTFFAGGTLDIAGGSIENYLDWWLLLRALLDERPIHSGEPLPFTAADGTPLDLQCSFSLQDDLDEMRHFLRSAGFLHLRGVFSEAEMASISADIDKFHDRYMEGDERSWWATTADGTRRLVRLQGFDQYSAATARLLQDPRFLRLGELTGDHHQHCGLENNAIEALIKPLNVVQGISDLPWHKDCSLGRHSYDCCSLTVGISVTGAGPDSGQLRVIAGSHRVLMWPSLLRRAERYGLPVIDLPTATGDLTVHLSCTHHMAQAPTARERRVLYTGFRLPRDAGTTNAESRDKISRSRELAYRTVSQ